MLIASGLGSGFLPWAPGTWGSAVGVLLWLLLPPRLTTITLAGCIGAIFALGWFVSASIHRRYGVTDPSAIVIDEIAGVWLALALLPRQAPWLWLLAVFVLFRLLDVWKPFPIRQVERRCRGGLGIMLDDLVAGALTALVLGTAYRLLG